MTIKKFFMLPIIFSISATLVTLLAESNLHEYLMHSHFLNHYFKSTDPKTLTFMVPAFINLLTLIFLEILIFVLPKHKSGARKRCKAVKAKMTSIFGSIYITIITSYILKVNDISLLKFTLTALILSQLYMVGLFLRSSVVYFIFLIGVHYALGLLLCFAFLKYFAFGYQMFIMYIKKMF